MPFTSGFIAKFGVIQAAVEVESYAIAIVAMVSAVVAAFLYLRIMVSMWLHGDDDATAISVPVAATAAIGLAAVFTIGVGVYPTWFIDWADAITLTR